MEAIEQRPAWRADPAEFAGARAQIRDPIGTPRRNQRLDARHRSEEERPFAASVRRVPRQAVRVDLLCAHREARIQIYVDDPATAVVGTAAQRTRIIVIMLVVWHTPWWQYR